MKSDKLFMPGYTYFIMAYLEALSYGLPILALDTFGVREFIVNGKSGFYVPPSDNLPIKDISYPSNMRTRKFLDGIGNVDLRVINNLTEKASILIENSGLREKMGEEALRLFKGKYSFKKKNRELK